VTIVTPEEAWEFAKQELQRDMPKSAYIVYVQDTSMISYKDGIFVIGAKNNAICAWLIARLTSTIRRMLRGIMNRKWKWHLW